MDAVIYSSLGLGVAALLVAALGLALALHNRNQICCLSAEVSGSKCALKHTSECCKEKFELFAKEFNEKLDALQT